MKLWSPSDIAKKSGVSSHYIRNLIRFGKIEAHKVDRQWVIEGSEAQRWLLERERQKKEKLCQ